MKRALTRSIYLLGVLIVMGFTIGAVRADPITITLTKDKTPGGVDIVLTPDDLKNSTVFLTVNPINMNMAFVNVMNNTGVVITELEIRFTPQPMDPVGIDQTGFFTTSPLVTFGGFQSQVVFTIHQFGVPGAGPGIPLGAMFGMKLTNFTPNTQLHIIPSGVPEPTTMLLLGTGLAGIAIKTRKRLKSREGRQGTPITVSQVSLRNLKGRH